jgi:CHAT domain-containing protein/lipopolysaccharide biosynthesis regulator YciM
MKKHVMVAILSIICFSLFSLYSSSQTITADTTLANQYFDLAKKYGNDSRFDSAIFYAEKAQVLNAKYFGWKSIKNANVLHLLGRLCMGYNKYDLALEYNLKALQIRQEILGERHPDAANSYNNIGIVYYNKGEYDKALEYNFIALQIRKEIFGEKNSDVAASYNNIGLAYLDKGEYDKALEYNFKVLKIRQEILGEKHPDTAKSYNNIGIVYYNEGEYDKALEYYIKALQIRKEIFGEKNSDVAASYNNIGLAYADKGEYDKALEYYFIVLQIRKEILGEKSLDMTASYNNIGLAYANKGKYDKALEYYIKALQIRKEILGEKNLDVADSYNNIGNVYEGKGENDKALEYHFKALKIRQEIFGEKHPDVAMSYNNIGNVYDDKGENDKALEYYFKSLQIDKEIYNEKHPYVASDYDNIGNVYDDKGENDKALEYHFKALKIRQEILGEKHPDVAKSYYNIGLDYRDKGELDKALEYYFKSLQIFKEIFGGKHPDVSASYYKIGDLYRIKGEYDMALEYYQKGVASCLYDFNDTVGIYKAPIIKGYLNWDYLLKLMQAKAQIIADKNKIHTGPTYNERKKIALRHYQACDTLIDITRKEITTQSDKLALGEKASKVYKEAIDLLTSPQTTDNAENVKKTVDEDQNLAFYFSEKNKSSVLLEALAGQEAMKFAGIPDNLLQKEHNLKIDIAFYTKQLSEPEKLDSAKSKLFQDRLFLRNRSYDSLIMVFEKLFPEYHNMKYNNKPATVKDIQKILDKKTAMISYFVGDSTFVIFTLTKSKMDVQKVPMIKNLNDSIEWFRYGLTDTSLWMHENYRRLGYKLYQQLLPKSALIDKQIKNLIIIPDGELAIMPFESLLTTNYIGDINAYSEYQYLIKKYNISYSYSTNLFYRTFSNQKPSSIEMTKLNDWLAFAPVFDNSGEQSMVMTTQELQRQLNWLRTDTLMINRSMFNKNNITPLPSTEAEAEAIFKLYDENNLKAKVLLHDNANEKSIKSGELEKYKVLHFATHGFVNSERPELSGLLLAQDTIGGEDGVLYSGEIYNLKLNADLVVLSACETGLGKIQKGEGIIGLTRALLYAGTKNIIVSLWQVADKSTSDLMVDFYKNSLASKGQLSYSEALRNAKLKMINEGKYAHPFFWSPFILIGK